jgi:hypothetical protein
MIWTRKFGAWTFEIIWSYGIGVGIRTWPPLCKWGVAVEIPLVIFTVWLT